VLDELERFPGYGVAVLHWFSGTQRELQRAVQMGCWFSIGSAMLQSAKGRALAARMPPDRVLTETDGPFGVVAGRPLQPGDCGGVIKEMSTIWQLDEISTRENIVASLGNLRRCELGLPKLWDLITLALMRTTGDIRGGRVGLRERHHGKSKI